MRREQEARHPIVIERLRNSYMDGTDYHLKIMIAGRAFQVGCSIGCITEMREGSRAVLAGLSDAIRTLLRSDDLYRHIMEQIVEIGRRNHGFDNTANLMEVEGCESQRIGVMATPQEMNQAGDIAERLRSMGVAPDGLLPRPVVMEMESRITQMDNVIAESLEIASSNLRDFDRLSRIQPPYFAQEYPISLDPACGVGDLSIFTRKKLDAPARRAWTLLYKTIGKPLSRQFKKHKYFEVQGKRGAYRFHRDKQGGVTFIETRTYGQRQVKVEFDLCVQSRAADLPEGDVILSRYLSWKADEEAFLQTANFRKVRTSDEAYTRAAWQPTTVIGGPSMFAIVEGPIT